MLLKGQETGIILPELRPNMYTQSDEAPLFVVLSPSPVSIKHCWMKKEGKY